MDNYQSIKRFLEQSKKDINFFCKHVFGVEHWSKQSEFLNLCAKYNRVSCRSGHKTGKSLACSELAFWWILTHKDAKVIILAPTNKQVEKIIWKELHRLYSIAIKRGYKPLFDDCTPHLSPSSGFNWKDGREIYGFTADTDKEKIAGFSGRILYIVDEASGVADWVIDVANTAPNGHVVMISNPTKNIGIFYDSFHAKSNVWKNIQLSSEECAKENIKFNGKYKYSYLANQDWLFDRRKEYKDENAFYSIRIKGEFPVQSELQVFSQIEISEAVAKWESTPKIGQTELGIDVARFGEDKSCVTIKIGYWTSNPIVFSQIGNYQLAENIVRIAKQNNPSGDEIIIKVDTSNGTGVTDILREMDGKEINMQVIDINSSESSSVVGCSRKRDEMWVYAKDFLRKGGTIFNDSKLIEELLLPQYGFDSQSRTKIESKQEIKKRIGRSIDRADSWILAIYNHNGVL